ncbi:MAG: hypothetical protein IJI14_08075 [Anaerolineaceae bacterium]|nr:hypothetical protein [Anaerolineaceae bacterium]
MTNNYKNMADQWNKITLEERCLIVDKVYENMPEREKDIISSTGKGIIQNLTYLAKAKRGDSATAKLGEKGAVELIAALGVWMVQNNFGETL